jgi:putative aldouronate transport system permease protein
MGMKRRLGVFDCVNLLLMLVVFAVAAYPFIHLFMYSVSEPSRLDGGMLILPRGFTLSSYRLCLESADIRTGFLVSVARTVVGPLSMLLVTSCAAFVLTKDRLPGVRFLRKYFVFTMYVSGGIIPTYVLMRQLHLNNTFFVYILPAMVSVFNLILIKTYLEDLPASIEESATIDGANEPTTFFRILLPLCTPILAAVALFGAIEQWNAFIDTQLYNAMNRRLYTLQYVLYNFLATQSYSLQEAKTGKAGFTTTPETLKMAITVITMAPILVIYPFVQKYFVSGLLVGAVKG